MSNTREVQIGGETRTIGRFKTYKAALAGDIIADVTKEIRDVFAEVTKFRREYREENNLQITRQMCSERAAELRAAAADARRRLDEEDEEETRQNVEAFAARLEGRAGSWERQLEDMGDRDYIEVPQDPSAEEQMLVAVPLALRTMRKQVTQLLALAIMPDRDLLRAWRDDNVHEVLDEYGLDLLEQLELGEELTLAWTVWEVAEAQLRPHIWALRKLQGLYDRQTKAAEPEATAADEPIEPEEPEAETPDETSTPKQDSPTSSTPSPASTAGSPSPSSSDSPTEPTSPSPVG